MHDQPVFLYTEHRRLWLWLARYKRFDKEAWPGWDKYQSMASGHCFACEYAYTARALSNTFSYRSNCMFCPLAWPEGIQCNSAGSLYIRWDSAYHPAEIRQLAWAIARVPVIKGVLWK